MKPIPKLYLETISIFSPLISIIQNHNCYPSPLVGKIDQPFPRPKYIKEQNVNNVNHIFGNI